MYSLDYGGGTANIEFETFTGLTNFWLNTVPYTALVPKAGEIPSIARTLKDAGHSTVAIHPYNGGMYKRNISLKNEGFDEFITEIEMEYTEHEGTSEYINDKSAYEETLKALRGSEDAQVVGLITMQLQVSDIPSWRTASKMRSTPTASTSAVNSGESKLTCTWLCAARL